MRLLNPLSLRSALLCLVCAGCSTPDLPPPNSAIPVRAQCPSLSSDSYFFPERSLLPESASLDREERSARSPQFLAASAVSLSCGPEPPEAYRVYWGGGGVGTVIASLIHVGSEWRASASELEPPLAGTAQAVARQVQTSVDGREAISISAALDAAGFWITPLGRTENDGTMWLIEARQAGRYRAVMRVQPSAELASIGRQLLRLAGMPIPDRMKGPD